MGRGARVYSHQGIFWVLRPLMGRAIWAKMTHGDFEKAGQGLRRSSGRVVFSLCSQLWFLLSPRALRGTGGGESTATCSHHHFLICMSPPLHPKVGG
jgi:hypothetical protein